MADHRACRLCGYVFPDDAPAGSPCPRCLLEAGREASTVEQERHAAHLPPPLPAGSFGPYKLIGVLGEGGMGFVYLAEQQQPIRRRVALKVLKRQHDRGVAARFELERQALALMNHPGIAKVFDAGTTEGGQLYFVMEYVPGLPITDYCDRHLLRYQDRLLLFEQVCQAVQHAHQRGIIHRDLKPSNVLVTVEDGKAVPKIIDFGIAKAVNQRLSEETVFTEYGMLIGTPEYMSPEQADPAGLDIGTLSDVYSLGVLLYELLVGALPFEAKALRKAGFDEIRRVIREEDPPTPSARLHRLGEAGREIARKRRSDLPSLTRVLHGDLEWITMKALEKDPARRYASASEFASDIGRHLQNEPVLASPPATWYRLRKFVRRHRAAVTLAGVLLFVLASATVVTAQFAVAAQVERAKADQRAADIRQLALNLLREVDSEIRRLPGCNSARGMVLQTALKALSNPALQPSASGFFPQGEELLGYFSLPGGKSPPHLPAGWSASGWNPAVFDIGIDRRVAHGGHASGYMFARDSEFTDWATLSQTVRADDFRGRRVKLSAYLRSENVLGGAALWMRVYGLTGTLAFDAMEHRLIRGTSDWKRYEVVLDVPEDSTGISFGLMLIGGYRGQVRGGSAWIDDVELGLGTAQDLVTQPRPPAEPGPKIPRTPMNLSLEL